MLPAKEFVDQVEDAYSRLYDLVYLRTHPLTDLLIGDSSLSPKEKAWQLHHLLLEVIGELKPAPQVPVVSRPWRRHQLLVLRYVRALDVETVAQELGISSRHYYREHRIAMEALAATLWPRRVSSSQSTTDVGRSPSEEQAGLGHLELLRLETARVAQASRFASVDGVVEKALALLNKMLEQRHVKVQAQIPPALPRVSVDESLFRQLLLGVVEFLVEPAQGATLRLSARAEEAVVHLSVRVDLDTAVGQPRAADAAERLAAIRELAALSGAQTYMAQAGETIVTFDLQLPVARRTVLVVDDNEDVLELFRRYLTPHSYHVVTTRTSQEALTLARQLKPYAITLDLMMPGQDGWDLLQTLLTQPETRQIPIIVCTVLKQKALALSLGASAFLEKPVSEQVILRALEALRQD